VSKRGPPEVTGRWIPWLTGTFAWPSVKTINKADKQQTYHNEFNVCIGCVNNNGPAAGVMQHDIDLLNVAQQQLVQQCIDMGSPATFTGTVVLPKSVAYPSGVVNATYAQNSTVSNSTHWQ